MTGTWGGRRGGGKEGRVAEEALLVWIGDEFFGGMMVRFWIRLVSEFVDCTVAVSDLFSGIVALMDKVWVSSSISIEVVSELVVATFLLSVEEAVKWEDLDSVRVPFREEP